MSKLSALRYYGGKSAAANYGIGAWIAEMLSWNKNDTYVEPFAGMLGVLLQRDRVNTEIVNDSNSHLVNWWLTVRDNSEKFIERLMYTPYSREVFNKARQELKTGSLTELDQAIAYHIILTQSINVGGGWRIRYTGSERYHVPTEKIKRLQKRMHHVQIENTCALKIIDRARTLGHVVMYLDPPYEGANVAAYGDNTVDFNSLRDLLSKPDNKARMAISGYGSSYDCLGWYRHEKSVKESGSTRKANDPDKLERTERTEVLWTNYDTTELVAPLFR